MADSSGNEVDDRGGEEDQDNMADMQRSLEDTAKENGVTLNYDLVISRKRKNSRKRDIADDTDQQSKQRVSGVRCAGV